MSPQKLRIVRQVGCVLFAAAVVVSQAQRVAASCEVVIGTYRSTYTACANWCADEHDPIAAGATCAAECGSGVDKSDHYNCAIEEEAPGLFSCSTGIACDSIPEGG